MENLDALLRFRRLDRNNCDEEAMVKLMTVAADRIAELEKAIKFALDAGLEQSSVHKTVFYGNGCGCCSETIDVPADILATLNSVL